MADYAPDLKRLLRESGFAFLRSGKGDHEIWHNSQSGRKVVVDHAIRSRHTANGVLRQAGLKKSF